MLLFFLALWRTVWQLRAVLVWKPSDKIWRRLQPSFTVHKRVRFISTLNWRVSKRGECWPLYTPTSLFFWTFKLHLWFVISTFSLKCVYVLLRLERVSRQKADQSTEELRSIKAEYDSSVAEMKKVRNFPDWLCCRSFVFLTDTLCQITSVLPLLWIHCAAQGGASKGQADSLRWSGGNEEGSVKADHRTAPTWRHHRHPEWIFIQHQAAASRWGGASRADGSWP